MQVDGNKIKVKQRPISGWNGINGRVWKKNREREKKPNVEISKHWKTGISNNSKNAGNVFVTYEERVKEMWSNVSSNPDEKYNHSKNHTEEFYYYTNKNEYFFVKWPQEEMVQVTYVYSFAQS